MSKLRDRLAIAIAIAAVAALTACGQGGDEGAQTAASAAAPAPAATPYPDTPSEPHLTNLRMLTHAGQNAEAYYSPDGKQLIFQATVPGQAPCDQQYVMDVDGGNVHRVSNGQGRTTCGYFFPKMDRILYSSTFEDSPSCPTPPDFSKGYVWPLEEHDIYTANPDGTDIRRLTNTPGYDAEATISPDGTKIVFTSMRDGDLDLYTMNLDGSDVRRLTTEPGYDGGAFFSPDSKHIVYRANHPSTPQELADYQQLLKERLVRPTTLEIWVMDVDGSNKRQVTHLDKASFAPYYVPNGRQIIFSSNLDDPQGRDFDLYLINVDGTGLERVTTTPEFDGFPMFSPDGKQLVFASNRGGAKEGDTNIFVADWVETPAKAASSR